MFDPVHHTYHDRAKRRSILTFCHGKVNQIYDSPYIFNYPYSQRYKDWDYIRRRDFNNPSVFSDMFFITKKVTSLAEQTDKYLAALVSGLLPGFDIFVVSMNVFRYTIDSLAIFFSGLEKPAIYPFMYNNLMALLIYGNLGTPSGLFAYYDVFSWQGLA